MSKGKFIKVTPKGSKESVVVLASNEVFWKSQGAKIEEPTQEEIEKFFPETKKTGKTAEASVTVEEYKALEEKLETANKKIAELEANFKKQTKK